MTILKVSMQLQKHFDIKDLEDVNYYLGIQVEHEADGLFLLNQRTKIVKLLRDYDLLESKSVATLMERFSNSVSRRNNSTRE